MGTIRNSLIFANTKRTQYSKNNLKASHALNRHVNAVGEEEISSIPGGSSSWSKNQTDMRQINRRKQSLTTEI